MAGSLFHRLVVTSLAVGGVLSATVAPAAATIHTVSIVPPSTLTISGTPPLVIQLGQPPAVPYTCAPNPNPWTPSNVDVDFDGLGNTSIDAPAAYRLNPVDFTAGGVTFRIRIEGVDDTIGFVDPLLGTAVQIVSLRARFLNCTGTQTLCLTRPATATLTGTWTGGLGPPGTAHVIGSAVVSTLFGCNAAIASAINGRTITLDLTLDA